MSDDNEKSGGNGGEEFLSRWSRLKREAHSQPPAGQQPATPVTDPKTPLPELPSLDKLTMNSDFRGFFHPGVDESLRRSALKKLFADPHFNIMDGLDVYIDDYSQPNPLPAAMLAQLRQAQKIIEWSKEGKGEDAANATELPDATPALPPAGYSAMQTPAEVEPPADPTADTEQRIGPQTAGPQKP